MTKRKKSSKISVIIPTLDSWQTLQRCIESINQQSIKPFEVIVVDNGSIDKTSQNVKRYFKNVKLATLYKNTGVTGGRNIGIKLASHKSDYLFFFDHDMIGEKFMLEELVKVAQLSDDIGIVTPKIFYQNHKKRIWSAGTSINLWSGQVLFRGGVDKGQFDKNEEVQVAPAAMLVKKQVIEKIGGFDNQYFATYEDTDFCFRTKKAGFKTYYSAKALAYHKLPNEPKQESIRLLSRAYWVGRNRIIFMKKYGNNFLIFLIFLPVFFLHYLILAIRYEKYRAGLNFLFGTLIGLFNYSALEARVPFTYMWILRNSVGKKTKTILDLGCGDGKLMQTISPGQDWSITGIEIDRKYILMAQAVPAYQQLIEGDLERESSKLISQGKKFDTVFSSQVIEHLPKDQGERLLTLIEKLAKKRIVITTPNGFMEQIEESLDDNPHQAHVSGWEKKDFSKRGYRVYGMGFKLAWSYSGLGRNVSPLMSVCFKIISFLMASLVYFFPSLGASLLAVKKKW